MAEFQEVMRQGKRMCERRDACGSCPIFKAKISCPVVCYEDDRPLVNAERIIMEWAAEHPELRYPTWEEWQSTNFAKSDCAARPCMFMHCKNHDECKKKTCMNHPIPADIANKLGIQPITEERVDK